MREEIGKGRGERERERERSCTKYNFTLSHVLLKVQLLDERVGKTDWYVWWLK